MYTHVVPRTTIYLDRELMAAVRERKLPVSAICQQALRHELLTANRRELLTANRDKRHKPQPQETQQ